MKNYFQISLNTNYQLVITYPRVIVGIEKGSVLAMEKKCGKLERSEVAHLELMLFGALHSAMLIAAGFSKKALTLSTELMRCIVIVQKSFDLLT